MKKNLLVAALLLLSAACAGGRAAPPELVRAFNGAIYDVVVLVPENSVEFTNMRATEQISAAWVDAFRTKMQKAGYVVVKNPSEPHDLTTKVVFDCVDSTLTLKLSDKEQVIDEIRIQEGVWLEACLNTSKADYVAIRLVNAYTRSANVSEFADNLELIKNPKAAVQAPKRVVTLPPTTDGRSGVAVYPFSGQGGAGEDILKTVNGIFSGEIEQTKCMRVVKTEVLLNVAEQLELKDRCLNESCQIDLARSANVDTLVRGTVSKVANSVIVSTTILDSTTRRIIYADKVTTTEAQLAAETEKLARRIRRFVICPNE